MSIAKAVFAHIARSSRTLRVESDFSLFYGLSHRTYHPTSKSFRSNMNMQSPFDPTTIHFHRGLEKDVSAVLKAYEGDESTEGVRKESFEKLRGLIHGLGTTGEYDLVDTSFGSLLNVPRPYHAPLECTIIDRTRPGGLPPSFGPASLPIAYDAIALGKYLSENGYTGSFVDARPDILGFEGNKPGANAGHLNLPPEPAWGQRTASMSSLFNILPPILRIKPASIDHPGILLNLAHPTNELRSNLVRHVCESSESLRILASFFWIWMRSHGVEHYSMTTCVFLVMFYLQDRHRLDISPAQDAHDMQQASQEYWCRIECGSEPLYEQLSVPSLPRIATPAAHLGALLFDFFTFWSGNKCLPYSRVLDPFTGSHVPRRRNYNANIRDLDEVQVMKDLKTKSAKGLKDALWEYQPLVLVDPFLGHHNLAYTVTKHALQRMFFWAQVSARTLRRGLPLNEILGPEAPPPALASLTSQDQSREGPVELQEEVALTSQVNSHITSSSGGPQTQRMYHTSTRIRAKEVIQPAIPAPPSVPQSVLSSRERTINRIQRAVQERYGYQYLVECFGSTQYGVDSPTSDLDLVVLDDDQKNGFTPELDLESLPVIYNVRNLAATLERNGFRVTRVVAHASVPIVKFEDPRTRLSCDINVNDRLGLYNTRLIAQYCVLSPLLRPLLMLLKKWAKTLGLNDPSGEGGTTTFSSYALTLMTVGFLQTHDLLPNLQAGLSPLTPEGEFWICGKDGQRTRCDPRFDTSPSWTAESNVAIQDLRGALIAWFRFWGHQFNYCYDIMSIRDGGVIPRAELSRSTITAEKQAKKRAKNAERKEKHMAKMKAEEAEKERKRVASEERKTAVVHDLEGGEGKGDQEVVNEEGGDEGSEGNKGVMEGDGKSPVQSASESEAEAEAAAEELLEDEGAEAAVDDVDQAAVEETDEADLQHGLQPRSWARSTLVVADPFIVAKNVTGVIIPFAISHFTAECRRSLLLLSSGANFSDLLGDGSALGRSGRRRKGGKPRGFAKKRLGGAGVKDRAKDAVRDRERRSQERDRKELKSSEKKERSSREREKAPSQKSASRSRAGSRSRPSSNSRGGQGGKGGAGGSADKKRGNRRGMGRDRGLGKGKEATEGRWLQISRVVKEPAGADVASTSGHTQMQPQAGP